MGLLGGGPHALACAALLPDLVTAAATLGSIAPYGSPGLDFFAGMGEDNVEGFTLYKRDPEAARAKHAQDREALLRISPEELSETLTTLLSPVDAAALTGDLASFLVSVFRDGLAPGDQGWWDDGMAEIGPWGFALDAIEVPVQIWHGAQDRFVPVQHGQWLAENIARRRRAPVRQRRPLHPAGRARAGGARLVAAAVLSLAAGGLSVPAWHERAARIGCGPPAGAKAANSGHEGTSGPTKPEPVA